MERREIIRTSEAEVSNAIKPVIKLAIGAATALLNLAVVGGGFIKSAIRDGTGDFYQLYIGSELGRTRYDSSAVFERQHELIGEIKPDMLPNRLPFYYWMLRPITKLPYRTAHSLWILILISSAITAIVLYRHEWMLAAWGSLPISILYGQDAALLLLILVVALKLRSAGHPFAAGMIASLLSIKYHLFILLPLAFFGESFVLLGAVSGVSILLAVSFISDGWRWPANYARALLGPGMNPSPQVMPNLHGALFRVPLLEWGVVIIVVTAVLLVSTKNEHLSFSVAAIGSFLISWHSYFVDTPVLLPAMLNRKISGVSWVILSPLCILPSAAGLGVLNCAALVIIFTELILEATSSSSIHALE